VFSECEQRLAALLLTSAPHAAVDAEIERINAGLPPYARVQRWYRLAAPFSPARQTMTVNGRLRRCQIAQQLPDILLHAMAPAAVTGARPAGPYSEPNPC
jgi:hypothetical protein